VCKTGQICTTTAETTPLGLPIFAASMSSFMRLRDEYPASLDELAPMNLADHSNLYRGVRAYVTTATPLTAQLGFAS
jgi:hypothetical protein